MIKLLLTFTVTIISITVTALVIAANGNDPVIEQGIVAGGGELRSSSGEMTIIDSLGVSSVGYSEQGFLKLQSGGVGPENEEVIIYVMEGASGDGTSWVSALGNLREALDEAAPGHTIWVASGTYTPVIKGSAGIRTDSFRMKNDVAIYGGFSGTEKSLSERNCQINKTVLSGEIGNPNSLGDNCYHVFYHPENMAVNGSAILDGFIITGGNANGTGIHASGGGMFNSGGSPTITNCTFSSNRASTSGGGIYNYASPATTVNCIFRNNEAKYGGAIFNGYKSSVKITNCCIYDNLAIYGGGITNVNDSHPVITNSIIWGNSASNSGHQMYNEDSSPYVSYSDIQGGWTGTGNINQIPGFTDPNNGDFHLHPDSVCIDAGSNMASAINHVDFEGDNRIMGGTVDMGADETISLALTITQIGQGSVSPVPGKYYYDQDQVISIIAESASCWQFDRWTGKTETVENVYDPSTTILMNNDYSISARFLADTYNLTLESANFFTSTPYEGTRLQDCGANIQIGGIITDCCYEFVHWIGDIEHLSGSPSDINISVIMPDHDISLTPTLAVRNVPLNLNQSAGGTILPYQTGTGSFSRTCGSIININAIPNNFYDFTCWEGDTQYLNSGSNIAANSLNIPCFEVRLTANFTPEKCFPFYYDKSESGTIDRKEFIRALMDYLMEKMNYSCMIDILMLYLTG